MRVRIDEDGDAEELADVLEEVARQLRDGMTSGYYPHWVLHDGLREETAALAADPGDRAEVRAVAEDTEPYRAW